MRRRASFLAIMAGVAVTVGIGAGSSPATPAVITGTTTQLTTDPAVQTDPSISGNVVVYTDQRNGNEDVYFRQIGGSETQVTTSTSPQRLHNVSGSTIVYTDLKPPIARIHAYDIVTGSDVAVSTGPDQNARIDGSVVAYERGSSGATDIWSTNLATGVEQAVAATAAVEVNPSVDGSRVVFERHAVVGAPGEIAMVDLATGQETTLSSGTGDAKRPDIDGDLVVWDVVTALGETDIVVHNLVTGVTTVVAQPGNQRLAHVSGDVVSFDDAASGNPDIGLYHVPTGTVQLIATEPGVEFLNDISGNRIVYASNQAGNFDIWAYDFTVQMPEIAVAPLDVDFGDVNVGTTGTTIVTVSNVGGAPLTVSGAGLAPSGTPFALTPAPTLPATIAPGATLDVPIAFSPTATGLRTATLTITSDDLDEGTVQVTLAGRGVTSQPPPGQQIADLLAFFDSSVTAGTLKGNGPGSSAQGRLKALHNMIEAAGDLIRRGLVVDACQQLADARDRADGQPQPPDFVQGSAATELRQRIEAVRATLGCA